MTYNLTEAELLEWGNEILRAAANNATAFEDHYRGRFVGCLINKHSILTTPLPPLPKKEDDTSYNPKTDFHPDIQKTADEIIKGYEPRTSWERNFNDYVYCYDEDAVKEMICAALSGTNKEDIDLKEVVRLSLLGTTTILT